jgi:hypothetical protein
MYKRLGLGIFLILILSFSSVYAQATPSDSVWFEPATAKAGEAITLNAFVYNSVQTPVTLTVEFRTSEKVLIGSKTVSLGVASGTTLTQSFTMPAEPSAVTVSIPKATNSKLAEVKGLEGTIGTIMLDANAPLPGPFPFEQTVSSWVKEKVRIIESWRLTKAKYYTDQKAHYRLSAGLTAAQPQEGKDLLPLVPEQPQQSQPQPNTRASIGTYAGLVWTTVCAVLFTNELVFYIVAGVIIFLILRFIIGRIF